ncbi:hypothetical protein BN1356_02195 [Streptococcus varani]|uniref:Uncharacterized protein n=1 Tax=Streptococcus varani TaxID=1608583 RepID=A0A0E4CTL6_9STRE|nr:hypothetical protein [Streptococcus varani]CQR25848.1 hypothetical protein BN1356_02195 [Streptococcus varani]
MSILGKPKYTFEDCLEFKNQYMPEAKRGQVQIVDAWGTFGQTNQPSYDIYVPEENCLYKHIVEEACRLVEGNDKHRKIR